ncbi:MAG TPA: 2-dehydropantoate 2-reductase [Actinomycetota bacterium]|nr:2-dehydropantoate 2-reductase [Actinomycetota bacterium]
MIGAGGVGGYFGGVLAHSGEDVVFVARGATLETLQQRGLRVDSIGGDFVILDCRATDDPHSVSEVDIVILGVKAWQVEEAAAAAEPMLGSEGAVLPLQNGVEAPGQVAATVGEAHTLSGLCRIISLVSEPGHIRHVGGAPFIAFNELDGKRSGRVDELAKAFEGAGVVDVAVPQDPEAALWNKFLVITSFAGVGGVTRSSIDVILELEETRRLLEASMSEIAELARARSVELEPEVVASGMALLEKFEPGSTSSMQRDIEAGRPSELEHLTGAVVRLAREAGVEAPVNEFLYAALLPFERAARA